jgi:AcrR family transcriptional regulator
VSEVSAALDGRHVRREQNREAVLDALAGLFEEGNLLPTSGEIAERAGLSPRSLFRYFDDIDDLSHATIDRQLARARPLLHVPAVASDPTAVKIACVVEARIRLFETIAPAARSARVCAHRHHPIAAQIAHSRSYLRRQLRELFAAELDATALLPALDALLSFETYELLRGDQRLSRPKTVAALTVALTALLADTRVSVDRIELS